MQKISLTNDADIPSKDLVDKWKVSPQTVSSMIAGAKRSTKAGELVKFLGEHGYTVDELPEWWGVHDKPGAPLGAPPGGFSPPGAPLPPLSPGQVQLLADHDVIYDAEHDTWVRVVPQGRGKYVETVNSHVVLRELEAQREKDNMVNDLAEDLLKSVQFQTQAIMKKVALNPSKSPSSRSIRCQPVSSGSPGFGRLVQASLPKPSLIPASLRASKSSPTASMLTPEP